LSYFILVNDCTTFAQIRQIFSWLNEALICQLMSPLIISVIRLSTTFTT
jgi:hypothetical protein